MTTSLSRLSVGFVMLAVTALLAGCDSAYPEPSEDAVYYFVANARLHGGMRTCWPAGQVYAVGITKADAALQAELNKLRALVRYEAEWPKDDPRWRAADAVKTHTDELTQLWEEGAEERQAALEAVGEAMDGVPQGLTFTSNEDQGAFKQRLWDALAVDGESLADHIARLEETLALRLRLFEAARAGAEPPAADATKPGPASERVLDTVDESREAYETRVRAERVRFFDLAEQRVAEIAPIIKEIDKQKQREQYNLLDNQCAYFRTRLEAMEREVRELIRDQQKTLKELEGSAVVQQASIDYHTARIEQLQTELADLTQRVERIKELISPQS